MAGPQDNGQGPDPVDQGSGLTGMRSAEEWLAARGVQRQPLVVRTEPVEPVLADVPDPVTPVPVTSDSVTRDPAAVGSDADAASDTASPPLLRLAPEVTEPRVIASTRLAEAAEDERAHLAALEAAEPHHQQNLSDDVAVAMSYIRAATAMTPMTEGRVSRKLRGRGHADAVVRLALEQARRERLVDDAAFAASLAGEWVAKGHAERRIRDDLRKREFDHAMIVETLASVTSPDPEAAAFAVARDRADQLSGLTPETAFRRLVAYLARRGHSEGLARKVARQVLWVEREQEQTAGH